MAPRSEPFILPAMSEKPCGHCGVVKPLSEFYSYPGQRFSWCKECKRAYARARRNADLEAHRARDRERRRSEIDKWLEIERRTNARRKSKPGWLEKSRQQTTDRLRAKHRQRARVNACVICAVEFCPLFGRHSWMDVCSPDCAREKSARRKRRKDGIIHFTNPNGIIPRKEYKRRARKRGANGRIEIVRPEIVFKRDGWRCQICGTETPEVLRGTFEPNAPEVDHKVPLSAGGSHCYGNVQCACRRCNIAKRDRVDFAPALTI